MRLIEHPDFAQLVSAAARATNTPEQFVEKDYHVTAILRLYRDRLGDGAVFKGGTSLSKGWGLVDRFSEDVDLFLRADAATPPITSKNQVDKSLKRMRDEVTNLNLLWLEAESTSNRGVARRDWFAYDTSYGALASVRPAVLVEIGTRSGHFPIQVVELNSMVGAWVAQEGIADVVSVDDIDPFAMPLLHFRRTFVEKLFALHSIVQDVERGGALGRNARHYADLHALSLRPEITTMLDSGEYRTIFDDCDEVSAREFPNTHSTPDGRSFSHSPALWPDEALRAALSRDYEHECHTLFYGPYPSFDAVLDRLQLLAPRL